VANRGDRERQEVLSCGRCAPILDGMEHSSNDVVVIGAGAAGLSAALVLGRARRRVAVIDSGAPRNAPAAHMQGYLSRDGVPPAELLAAGRREVQEYGVRVLDDLVTAVAPGTTSRFEVHLATGAQLDARRVILATGLRDLLPDIPGVAERWGRDLLHCPYCHGYEVRDQPLGVLGGNPEAVQHALLVRQWSSDVTLFPHTDALDDTEREQLAARGITVVGGTVAALAIDGDHLSGVELADGRLIPRTAVFVRPRLIPHTALLVALGAVMDQDGWVQADAQGRTSVHGVWVAGNACNPRAQVITAAGEGSAVAIALNADLVAEDVERDVTALRARA
jgi:thioredoxin reductase